MESKNLLISIILLLVIKYELKAHNPTWTDGIACIIYSHCTGCHNPNGIAPFSLLTYDDVYQNRYSIAASVEARSMPPFPASQIKRQYAHANTLAQHEIDEIKDWVNNFALLGNATKIPEPPTYSSKYQIPNPDFIGKIPTYTITSDNDVYRMFVIPINNTTQQIIQSIEVYPGNREIVHHALVFQDTSALPYNLDLKDPLPGYSAFGGTGSSTSKLITGYTPGQGAFHFAPGFGTVLAAKSYIILQMHYPGGVRGEVDSTQVRIKYGSATLRNVTTLAALNHNTTLINGPLFIPANSTKTFYSQVKVNTNRTLTGIMPHMHLIGKSIKAYCITPNQDTIHLIDIPEWDFHWQYFYQFQKPVLLPAGSTLYGEATYDNTSNNDNNPNNPPKNVSLGEGTDDEMFLIYMNLSNFMPSDTNIIIDTESHFLHDSSCYKSTATTENHYYDNVKIYPNPTSDLLFIEGMDTAFSVSFFNNKGQVVLSKNNQTEHFINIQNLLDGIYYLQIGTIDGDFIYKKFIKTKSY